MIAGLTVVEFLRVFVLVGVGVVLLYPVAASAPRVMHTNAIFMLTATLAVLAVSVVVQAFQGRSVVSEGLQVAASGGYLWSVWLFAREYDSRRFVTGPERRTHDDPGGVRGRWTRLTPPGRAPSEAGATSTSNS